MRKLLAYLRSIDQSWLIAWILIFVGFLSLDLIMPDTWIVTAIKLIGIFLCVIYSYQKFRSDPLLTIALSFTLLADVILALDNISLMGVFVFCIAQFFHTSRFIDAKPVTFIIYFCLVLAIFFLFVALGCDPMYVIAGIYGYSLFSNIFISGRWFLTKKSVASRCAFIGFVLFFCCDFCVGASYLSTVGVLPFFYHRIANYLAWMFYYPSQVLISNSSRKPSEKIFVIK